MPAMKHLGLILVLAMGTSACENTRSRLDQMPTPAPTATATAADGTTAPGIAAVADHSGTVEERLARLETYNAKNAEALAFLGQVFAQQKQQAQAEERKEPAPDAVFAVAVAEDVKAGLVEGPATAPVTIVKAFDFACPYCMQVNTTMDELVKEYGGKVRVVYKNMVVHPTTAMNGHLASCAASKQGKYTAFKDAFWEKAFTPYAQSQGKDPSKLGKENILAIAKDLGLDTGKLAADMDGAECKKLINDDMAELAKFNVSSTPTFFINGKVVPGALPKEAFKTIIDERLKVAEASGVSGAEYYEKEVIGKGEKKFRSKLDPKPN